MLDRVDRYILRQFAMTFVFGVVAFVAIYIAVDLMEHLDDFLDRNVPAGVIVLSYVYSLPDIIHLVLPIDMLLASLFTVGKLDNLHELTAIRASGRSLKRLIVPLLLFGVLVSLGMVYFDGWVVPYTNKERFAIERQYLGGSALGGQRNVFLRPTPSVNVLIDYFDPNSGIASRVSIERIDTAAPMLVAAVAAHGNDSTLSRRVDTISSIAATERIDAESMRYDSTKRIWVLQNGIARNLSDPVRVGVTGFQEREIPFLKITPEELNLTQQNIRELTMEELQDRIAQEELSGRDVTQLNIEYYARISFPFTALIVILFGIPFSTAQRKGGTAVHIAVTAVISAIYLIVSEVSKTFSYSAELPPILTAWMANIVFGIVGVANLFRIDR